MNSKTINEQWDEIAFNLKFLLGTLTLAVASGVTFGILHKGDFTPATALFFVILLVGIGTSILLKISIIIQVSLFIRDARALADEHAKMLGYLKRSQQVISSSIERLAVLKQDVPHAGLKKLRTDQISFLLDQAIEQLPPDITLERIPDQFDVLKTAGCKETIRTTLASGRTPAWLVQFAAKHHGLEPYGTAME